MLCYLPTPYPDELLYSVIARYLKHIAAPHAGTVSAQVFGRRTRSCVDLPSSLNVVSRRTWFTWGMTGKEIADQLTLFPYYARYVPNQRAAWCLDALLSDNGGGVHLKLGVNSSRVGVPRYLRFCPTCRTFDIYRYGEPYWHRTHQIAGVLVCPDHGDQLIESDAPMKPKSHFDYVDATESMDRIALPSKGNFGSTEATNVFKIAGRCRDMLRGPIASWPFEGMPAIYRSAVLERGFSEGPTRLFQTKFENAFVAFYGQALLARLGYEVQLGKEGNWIRSIFQAHSYSRAFHPLQHALVQIFLESVPVDSSKKIPIGLGPWKCPNPYAVHEEPFPIKRVSMTKLYSDEFSASAKCSCSFRFTFSRTSDTDPTLPIVKYISGSGPTWAAEAERLRQSGLNISAIAKRMGISYKTVQRLLKRKPSTVRVLPAQLEEWKREWLKLLDQVPNRRRSLARKLNSCLYMKLRRWDKEWLFALPQLGNFRYRPKSRVDWAIRDKEWSEILRAAAQKIKASGLPRRVAPLTIIKASGLPETVLTRPIRLPICRAVLKECSESSLDDSRERRLRAAVNKARAKGWPLKDWTLKYLSGLTYVELSPRLRTVLQSLVVDRGD